MAIEPVRALGRVLRDVEERPVVGGPRDRHDLLDVIGQERAGAQILDRQRVLPEPGEIGRIGEEVAVVAHHRHAEGEERMARRERIEIERHLFGRVHASRLAAEDGVLLALLRARVIEVVAAAVRDGLVVLLDARQHLRVERVDERRRGLHDRLGVGVLRAEVRHHLGVVLPAKPEIVVRAPITVHGVDPGNPSGGGRRRRRGGGSGVVAHGTAGHSTTGKRARAMRRAHLLRWRPRLHAQRRATTPRVQPSGAASQLDPSHRSSSVSPTGS